MKQFLATLPEAVIWAAIGVGAVLALLAALLVGLGMVAWDIFWDLGGHWADLKRRVAQFIAQFFPSQRNH